MPRFVLSLVATMVAAACARPVEPPARVRAEPRVEVRGLRNIQRTLRLLHTSTETNRNAVRILFYGQSITESAWSRKLESLLRARYPHADLHVENRAIGGFPAQLLVHAAETDLYPYYPDLVVFHVFGAHDRYEDIIRRIRERTTAEVLLQTDHVTKAGELREERDPAKLSPSAGSWSAFMNHRFLPGLVQPYQTALCDQREAWKRHLRARSIAPDALLSDGMHLNAAGDALMARFVADCLRRAPELDPSPAEEWVRTYRVGEQIAWEDGILRLPFVGNRVDAIVRGSAGAGEGDGEAAGVRVSIDGRPPSTWRELYAFSRARAGGAGKWPPLFELSAEAPLLLENWQLIATRLSSEPLVYGFELSGSKTGFDGRGRSDQRFVSSSRRVVIDPDDWNIQYAFELGGTKPPPARFTVSFRVEPHFTDTLAATPNGPRERVVTLAQGLPNTTHTLELRGATAQLAALRVYRPARDAAHP